MGEELAGSENIGVSQRGLAIGVSPFSLPELPKIESDIKNVMSGKYVLQTGCLPDKKGSNQT